MFVLYYEETNYDGGEFYLLKVSKDRSKLESILEEYIEHKKKYDKEIEEYTQRKINFFKEKANQVADWLKENKQGDYIGHPYYYEYKNVDDYINKVRNFREPYDIWKHIDKIFNHKECPIKKCLFPEIYPGTIHPNPRYLRIEEIEEV